MRQLVSVLQDGSLRYFVHDGDQVQQVAQLLDPGTFDVSTVIEIGVSIGGLYEQPANGHASKAAPALPAARVQAKAVTAAKVTKTPEAKTPEAKTPAPAKRPRQSWGVTMLAVLEALRAAGSEGATLPEMSQRIAGTLDTRAQGSVAATMHTMRKAGRDIRRIAIPDAQRRGVEGPRLRYVLHESD